ncbi:MAG: HEAT repeat domain-containing protein [Gemmatales bacterium]|nr:HEAT repeat domain-containing protein [Gemmatales bacterium]MDW8222150.1 HEAT repeat domain-containing protein [Gemmatales bacterium]
MPQDALIAVPWARQNRHLHEPPVSPGTPKLTDGAGDADMTGQKRANTQAGTQQILTGSSKVSCREPDSRRAEQIRCRRSSGLLTWLRWAGPWVRADSPLRFLSGLILAATSILSTGCAYFWEDITAHSPEGGFVNDMKYRLQLLFNPPHPLDVLAHSQDGDFRARAYRQLKEPREYGGSEEDQQKFLEGLIWGAKNEPDVVARIAAIERLAQCRDERAREFFFRVEQSKEPVLYYDREVIVQIASLNALGQLKDQRAVPILAKAAQFGASLDVRLNAVRALRNFPSAEAAQVMVEILRDEERKLPSQRQVALQHEARENLRAFTGRDFPAEAQPWADYLALNPPIPAPDTNPLIRLVNWWEGR